VLAAPPVASELEWAWQRLLATDGAAPIGDLAQELGWSRRHLAARFRTELGMPPKAVARILRFERAVARLRAGDDLAELALDCGYYDQAHFNRDFRAFADATPTELRQPALVQSGAA
jgi:AraC-like DNA-binding protein